MSTCRWITVVFVAFAGCGGEKRGEPTEKRGEPTEKTYRVVGEVRKVDAEAGRVTIAHEAIPGFMDAMTMPFRVAKSDRSLLEDLREGDKVAATLTVGETASSLSDIKVTQPSPPQAMTLDLSGGAAELRPSPKPFEPGEAVPDFSVTLQDGSALRLSDLRGKVVALTFVYTRCPIPEFCPAMDARFAELQKRVATDPQRVGEVRLLSISFDPEHDTPEVLAKHAASRGAKPPLWRFAVASHEELAKVAERFGLAYGPRKGEIIHNLSTAVIGPDGKLVVLYRGSGWTVDDAYRAIRSALP